MIGDVGRSFHCLQRFVYFHHSHVDQVRHGELGPGGLSSRGDSFAMDVQVGVLGLDMAKNIASEKSQEFC